MGVLPLRLPEGWRASAMRISPRDVVEIDLDFNALSPRARVRVTLRRTDTGETMAGEAEALLETDREVALVRAGGIIPMILRRALDASHASTKS